MTRVPKVPASLAVPTALAIASVHPDYLEACLDGCCTGLKHSPKLESGTITLLRRTSGGQGKKQYGVVGVWWYTGESSSIRPGDCRWPRRWSYRVQFKPLVLRFEETFCESFNQPMPDPGAYRGLKRSTKIPELVYTALQGSLIKIKDPQIAVGYLLALLKEKSRELQVEAPYQGEIVRVDKLLSHLVALLSDAGDANANKQRRCKDSAKRT